MIDDVAVLRLLRHVLPDLVYVQSVVANARELLCHIRGPSGHEDET